MRIHLNIGSNLNDRLSNIGKAVALLSRRFKGARILLSDYVESEPWGFESENTFLNRGILVIMDSEMNPFEVLDITQSVERSISDVSHRNDDGSYCDRVIDIDIIDIEGTTLSTPRLTLPHPRASQRDFVIGPMHQLEEMATILHL